VLESVLQKDERSLAEKSLNYARAVAGLSIAEKLAAKRLAKISIDLTIAECWPD